MTRLAQDVADIASIEQIMRRAIKERPNCELLGMDDRIRAAAVDIHYWFRNRVRDVTVVGKIEELERSV